MAPPRTMTAWSFHHWRTHAELLARVRASCWCDAQLEMLDRLIGELADMYEEQAPRAFDREWFCKTARRYHGRLRTTINLNRRPT